ncbi:MAG TPA: M23 family metallopeptidase [Candidatus Dormibacteraeota bacterium]
MIRPMLVVAATCLLGSAGLAAAAGGAAREGVPTSGGFVSPVDGAPVSQPYGCTALAVEPPSRLCPQGHFHSGVDLAAPAGTPVRATLAGVAHVVVSATGYGLHVVVDHGVGLSSLYAHLSAALVVDGAAVAAGEVIGAVGSSGNSTGPHLHFEILRDGLPEDPSLDLTQGSPAPHHGEQAWSTGSFSSATSPVTPRRSPPRRP